MKSSPQQCTNVTPAGDVNGHYAVGLAVDWNDPTTPYTIKGHGPNSGPGSGPNSGFTFHVGSAMDWYTGDYCPGGSNPNTYPSGSFSTQSTPHTYSSLDAYNADTNNGHICVNMYDIHQQNNANDWNPSKNGDNSIQTNNYSESSNCTTAQVVTAAPAAAPASISIRKFERIGTSGPYSSGPLNSTVGDTVYYVIRVSNTSSTSLSVSLSDAGCDPGTISPSGTQSIAAGATLTYSCSHVLASVPSSRLFINTASATGTTPAGATVGPVSSSVVARVAPLALRAKTLKVAKPTRPVVKAAKFTG